MGWPREVVDAAAGLFSFVFVCPTRPAGRFCYPAEVHDCKVSASAPSYLLRGVCSPHVCRLARIWCTGGREWNMGLLSLPPILGQIFQIFIGWLSGRDTSTGQGAPTGRTGDFQNPQELHV